MRNSGVHKVKKHTWLINQTVDRGICHCIQLDMRFWNHYIYYAINLYRAPSSIACFSKHPKHTFDCNPFVEPELGIDGKKVNDRLYMMKFY